MNWAPKLHLQFTLQAKIILYANGRSEKNYIQNTSVWPLYITRSKNKINSILFTFQKNTYWPQGMYCVEFSHPLNDYTIKEGHEIVKKSYGCCNLVEIN